MCLEKRMWDTTVLGVRLLVCSWALFPRGHGTAANAHERTYTPTHMNPLCLELRVLGFTKEPGCFMCVWLSCFSWSEIASLTMNHCSATEGEERTWGVSKALQLLVHPLCELLVCVLLMTTHSQLVAFIRTQQKCWTCFCPCQLTSCSPGLHGSLCLPLCLPWWWVLIQTRCNLMGITLNIVNVCGNLFSSECLYANWI